MNLQVIRKSHTSATLDILAERSTHLLPLGELTQLPVCDVKVSSPSTTPTASSSSTYRDARTIVAEAVTTDRLRSEGIE